MVIEIWLISQCPVRHTGVACGAKIVFTRPGLARLLRYGHGVKTMSSSSIKPAAPKWLHFAFQRPISYLLTLSNQNLFPRCNTGGEVSLQAESWKTPPVLVLGLYVQNISGCQEKKKKKELKIRCHFKFHYVTVRKLLWLRTNESSLKEGGGEGDS